MAEGEGTRLPPVPDAQPSTSSKPASRNGSVRAPSARAGALYDNFAQADGSITVAALTDLLQAADVGAAPDTTRAVASQLAGPGSASLTRDQALAVVGLVAPEKDQPAASGRPSSSAPAAPALLPAASTSSQPASAPGSASGGARPSSTSSSQPPASTPSAFVTAYAPSGPGGGTPGGASPGGPPAGPGPAATAYAPPPPPPQQQQQQQQPLRHEPSSGASSFGAPPGSETSSGAGRPFRRLLTKNRAYLETGSLHVDEAVLSYMAKLEEHRRRCEAEGRYQEAKVAARRLADLRTAQVERLRAEMASNQMRELEEVAAVFEEETQKFIHVWNSRTAEYSAQVAKGVEDLKAAHRAQVAAFVADLQRRRPTRARPSRDYLAQREVQDKLARAGLYGRATAVKDMADDLYQAELESTIAAWEAESKLKIAKVQTKQQNEYEALTQRAAKGRDELELKRVAETERRALRYRNIVSELEQLHKLELAHLENFLDAQVLAGKASPLKDPGAFRRKREQLLSLTLW